MEDGGRAKLRTKALDERRNREETKSLWLIGKEANRKEGCD